MPDTPASNSEPIGALAENYARALFDAAQPAAALDEIAGDLRELVALLAEHPGLAALFENRMIDPPRRAQPIDRLFAGRIHDLTLKFLHVLNRKGRLDRLGPIARAFDRMLKEHRGQVDVEVYTAQPLTPELAASVAQRISKAIGREAVLHPRIDPSLLGGLKVRVGDRLLDASVAAQLRRLTRRVQSRGRDALRHRAGEIFPEPAEASG